MCLHTESGRPPCCKAEDLHCWPCMFILSKSVVVSPALFDAAMRVRHATSAVTGPCPAGVSERSCSEAAATVRWPPCSLRQRGRPVACCRIRWAPGTVPGSAAPSSAGTCSFSRGPADLSSTNYQLGCQWTAEGLCSNIPCMDSRGCWCLSAGVFLL